MVCDYLQMPLTPQKVPFKGDMFGKIPLVKFDDYDQANEETFLELALEYYLERVLYENVVKVEPMPWAHELSNAGIFNFLRIPHFGRYLITNFCMCQLLALVHDGCLWIQNIIPIDAALIDQITNLPKKGPHPMD